MNERTTPGPWEIVPDEYGGWSIIAETPATDEWPKGVIPICRMDANDDDYPNVEADARLIAASPDLLTATKDGDAVLTALIEAMPDRFSPDLLTQLEFTRDTCRAAVAKATGEGST